MKISKTIFTLLIVVLLISGCVDDTKLIFPPDDAVNRVTDFYFFKDGKSFMYLSSNMNRKYDFGQLVIMEFDDDDEILFVDSITVPSLAGKMVVNSKESMVYVTSRDMHGLVRIKISGKTGGYRLSYIDSTDGNIPSVLKTQKEPYAVILSADEERLFVTHLLNGEFSIVDTTEWKLLETYKMKYGVTDIAYDVNSGYYIASHRSSGNLTLIEPSETLSGFNVGITETTLDIPTDGYDIRSLKASSDGESFYVSFQNYIDDSSSDSAPQLISFRLSGKKSTSTEIIETVALKGKVGEIALFPYVTGVDENEYNGELVFAAMSSEENVYIVDSSSSKIIEKIKLPKCEPYQLKTNNIDNSSGILLVSCFIQDKILVYSIDMNRKELIKELGVIK